MPIIVGIVVLIHLLVLWLATAMEPLVIQPEKQAGEKRITVSLKTPAIPVPPPQIQPPARPPVIAQPEKNSSPKRRRHVQLPEKIRTPFAGAEAQPETVKPLQPDMPVPDDMSTMIEAARKRRAAEAAVQNQEKPDDNSIARANVALSVQHAMSKGDNERKGVFEMRGTHLHDAEFMFYGWSKNFNRNMSRLVEVDQGADVDIETAVVKKMIEIIREHTTDTFQWESARLNQKITLSARREDTAGLQVFLMREFFPNHASPAG